MTDPFRRLIPGTRLGSIDAESWNAMLEAAEYFRGRGRPLGAGEPGEPSRRSSLIRVKNVSGGDVPMGGVLGLGSAVFDPADASALSEFLRVVVVEGDTAAADGTLVGVAAEPIPDGAVRHVWVSGVCPARVRFTSGSHGYAKPDGTNVDYMASDASAGLARVIAKEAGTPPYTGWAYVLLGLYPPEDARIVYRGKLDGALSAGGSATMSIWEYSGGSETDTGNNITVYDWLLASGSVASGKKVVALYDGASGRHYVVAAECP